MCFFYQIYDELKIMHDKYNNLEEVTLENFKVTMQNKKKRRKTTSTCLYT